MTKIANAMITSNSNSIPCVDPLPIRLAIYLLLLDLLDYITPPLLLALHPTRPFYLPSVPMNLLLLHTPRAFVGTTIPLLLPPHVNHLHHLLLHPSSYPLNNVINAQLTSPPSSQAPAIHYLPKTTLNASPANNLKNSLTIKSALSPNNLNAILPPIQQIMTSSPKVLRYASLCNTQDLASSALGFSSMPTLLCNSAILKHSLAT